MNAWPKSTSSYRGRVTLKPLRFPFHPAKSKSQFGYVRGFTLLEILVAIGVFAFMFIFIAQAVRQSYRQAGKIKKDVQFKQSFSHVLDLIRRDFQGVAYFLDVNDNLNSYFPVEKDQEEGLPKKAPDLPSLIKEEETGEEKKRSSFPVRYSPYFIFEGESEELWFVSHSFSQSVSASGAAQWVQIHYHVGDCRNLKDGEIGSCLVRTAGRYWNPEEKGELEKRLVLFRGLDSLRFFYTASSLSPVWEDSWKPELVAFVNSPFSHPAESFFPALIKMELEKEQRKESFLFPVSQSYLKAWRPNKKAYEGLPKWNPPKLKKEEQRTRPSGRQNRSANPSILPPSQNQRSSAR